MSIPGSYRIASRNRAFDDYLDPEVRSTRRVRRIIESLREEIVSEDSKVRVRRILERPREIFRLEIERPEFGVQRTTLLDREALEELLRAEEIRSRVRMSG